MSLDQWYYIRQYINSSLQKLTKMAKIGTWQIITNLQCYAFLWGIDFNLYKLIWNWQIFSLDLYFQCIPNLLHITSDHNIIAVCDDECLTLLKGLQLDAQVVIHFDLPGSNSKFGNCLCYITCNMWPWYYCSVWWWMPHTTEGSTVRRSGRYTLRPPRIQLEVWQLSMLYYL